MAAKTQYNLKNAKEYFEEHLCVGDYYTEGQQVMGEWFGLGGERLGLSGKVRADEFIRLCENQHLVTGKTLTQRLPGLRNCGAVAETTFILAQINCTFRQGSPENRRSIVLLRPFNFILQRPLLAVLRS